MSHATSEPLVTLPPGPQPPEPQPPEPQRRLQGEVVALAGRLDSLTRSEAIELIQAHGGVYAPRVTRRTTTLVLGLEKLPLARNGRVVRNLREAQRLQAMEHRLVICREPQFLQQLGLTARQGAACRRHTLGELARIVGVSRDRLRGWLRAGLVRPIDTAGSLTYFDFRQVALVKQLCELTASGVSASRLRKSLRQLRRWLPDVPEALARLELFEGLLVVRREDGRTADVAGQLLFDFDAASKNDAAQASPATLPHSAPSIDACEELFQEALAWEGAGQHAKAAAAYHAWLLEHGPAPQVCFNLGNALMAAGRREAAMERYRQAVELDPCYGQAWNNLADALAGAGEHDAALTAWRRAVDADPDCAEALYNLGDALQSDGDAAAARPYWRAYLRHDRQSEWADYARSCLKATASRESIARQ